MSEIKIYGTLVPGTVNETIATTDNIFDNKINKTQEEINADIYTKLEDNNENVEFISNKFVHKQNTPSYTWIIEHNLNGYPIVTVYDNNNKIVITDVEYLNADTIKITSTVNISGTAICII